MSLGPPLTFPTKALILGAAHDAFYAISQSHVLPSKNLKTGEMHSNTLFKLTGSLLVFSTAHGNLKEPSSLFGSLLSVRSQVPGPQDPSPT